MKIKTRLQVSVILIVVLTVTIGLFLFMAVQNMNDESEEARIAATIVKDIAELKIVAHEYLLHPGERPLMQWKSKYDFITKYLTREANIFDSPDEKIAIGKIVRNLARFETVFRDLTTGFGKEQGPARQKNLISPELRNRLIGEMLVKSQATVSPVFRLQQVVQAELVSAQKRTSLLIFVFLVILAALVTVISLWVNKSIGIPIAKLERGAQIIGSGNLDHKVGTAAKDEIGQLSRAFDKMTDNLRETTASVVDLNREISERKQAEAALSQSEGRYRQLFETVSDAIMLFDVETKGFIDANAATLDLYGYTKQEFLELSLQDITAEPEETMETVQKIVSGKITHVPVRLHKKKDGTAFPVEISSGRFEIEGRVVLCGVVRDITERKQAEEELRESETRLQQAQKMEAIGILGGGIAHDFNNLLSIIIGNIELAKDDITPEAGASESLNEAIEASLKAQELTKHLITFSKGGAPVKKTGSIEDLVKEITDVYLSDSEVKCEFIISSDLYAVKFDKGQMNHAIKNIIINAVESMPDRGLIIVKADNFTKTTERDLPLPEGKYVKISIRDQGNGIPEEHLSKIFDPYFSTKEMGVQKGMGLGLATTYSIINRHDGHIIVESKVGIGSTFHIYLPAVETEGVELIAKGGYGVQQSTISNRQSTIRRVLIMDDEEMIRNLSRQVLSRLGYEPALAKDGAEAIALYKRAIDCGKPFDAAILDLTIKGGEGGKEVIKQLMEIDPDVKAIVSSGYFNDPVMTNFRAYGFVGALPKPYMKKDLSETLNKITKD